MSNAFSASELRSTDGHFSSVHKENRTSAGRAHSQYTNLRQLGRRLSPRSQFCGDAEVHMTKSVDRELISIHFEGYTGD